MSAFKQDLYLDQGADLTFTSPALIGPAGTIQDFTGAHTRMMIRTAPSDAAPALSLTDTSTANGVVAPNGAAGTTTTTITKIASSALSAVAPMQYDQFVDLANGTSVRLLSGRVFVSPSITH